MLDFSIDRVFSTQGLIVDSKQSLVPFIAAMGAHYLLGPDTMVDSS